MVHLIPTAVAVGTLVVVLVVVLVLMVKLRVVAAVVVLEKTLMHPVKVLLDMLLLDIKLDQYQQQKQLVVLLVSIMVKPFTPLQPLVLLLFKDQKFHQQKYS
jgi:hypothetical protein